MEPHKETKQNTEKYNYNRPAKHAIKNKTNTKHHFVVPWELIDDAATKKNKKS